MPEVDEMPVVSLKKEPFKIMVGERGTDHYMGRLEKGQGNSIADGPLAKGQPITGRVMFPNYAAVWGRRVVDGKVPKGRKQVEVTDNDYTGEIQYLPFGDPRGYSIFIMYRKGMGTLDYQYQVLRLHLDPINKLSDDSLAYISMVTGEHDIDPTLDKFWAEMIQVHYENEDSPAAAIRPEQFFLRLIKPLDAKDDDAKDMMEEYAAMSFVHAASGSFKDLEVLRIIIEPATVKTTKKIEWDSKKESTLMVALGKFAKAEPKAFIEAVNEYKRNVSDLLSKMESYEVLDYEVSGKIVVRKPKVEVLIEDESIVGGEAETVNAWLFERCMKEKVFNVLDRLSTISKNLK